MTKFAMNGLEAMANRFGRMVVHTPDPNGLPGRYPVLIAKCNVNVILPDISEISFADWNKISNINLTGMFLRPSMRFSKW